jgi:hypothetical protein
VDARCRGQSFGFAGRIGEYAQAFAGWQPDLLSAAKKRMDQLAGLTEKARKLALGRFRLLQPHLEDDRPLKAVAAAAGIPFRTVQRWLVVATS